MSGWLSTGWFPIPIFRTPGATSGDPVIGSKSLTITSGSNFADLDVRRAQALEEPREVPSERVQRAPLRDASDSVFDRRQAAEPATTGGSPPRSRSSREGP